MMIDFEKYYIKDEYETANEGVMGKIATGIIAAPWVLLAGSIIGISIYNKLPWVKKKRAEKEAKDRKAKKELQYQALKTLYPMELKKLESGKTKELNTREILGDKIDKDIKKIIKCWSQNKDLNKKINDEYEEFYNNHKNEYTRASLPHRCRLECRTKLELGESFELGGDIIRYDYIDGNDEELEIVLYKTIDGNRLFKDLLLLLNTKYSKEVEGKLVSFEEPNPDEFSTYIEVNFTYFDSSDIPSQDKSEEVTSKE